MEATEERLMVYDVDVLDYQSILVSLNNCNVVFCCLDNPEGYDVSFFIIITHYEISMFVSDLRRLRFCYEMM